MFASVCGCVGTDAHKSQKRSLDPLELESQEVINCSEVGTGNLSLVP